MEHSHSHGHHHHESTNYNKAFAFGILLNVAFVAIELFYGFLANSSALIADAGHNASDVLGLVFAWMAVWLAGKKATLKYSYGFKKSTILISVFNAMLLFVAVGFILYDAIHRFFNPVPVVGSQMMIVAGIGVVINTITALLFIGGQKHDLNIRGAFLHMAADAAVSLGVVAAGFLIRLTGVNWIDPLMSILIVIIIVWGTWRLFMDAVNLALDGVPHGIDLSKIDAAISSNSDVVEIHDLHVWALSTSENALSVHVITQSESQNKLLEELQLLVAHEFNIHHATIQIEGVSNNLDCKTCS